MKELENARAAIREADEQMARLFLRRMEAVKDVAAYKQSHGLPVMDKKQEQRVLEAGAARVEDAELRAYYLQFLQQTMALSRNYQHRLLEGMRVAFSGVEGAFAHIAAKRIFPDGVPVGYGSFEDAYEAVRAGECDCAVLPIENSYAGEVGQVIDLMFGGELFVNGVYDLPITQHLLGVEGAQLSDIHTVLSHPQALSQCASYIRRHGLDQHKTSNTAVAAQTVAEKGDIHTAAIASYETAALYGLAVLDHDINESKQNTTRFAVFSRAENRPASGRSDARFLLLFSVNNTAGSLARAISVIGEYGFNMNALRSRPLRELPWQYYFYVEAEGDEDSENGRRMLAALKEQCNTLKLVGHFTAAPGDLKEEEA